MENNELIMELRKLINGEAVAAIQYTIAAKAVVGPNQSYLVEHFNDHAYEERDHYGNLVKELMKLGATPELNLPKVISECLPATVELTNVGSAYLTQFFIDSETNATKAYESFYARIKDTNADIADVVLKIIQEEKEHALDFSRIGSVSEFQNDMKNVDESGNADFAERTKLIDKLLQFNYGSWF